MIRPCNEQDRQTLYAIINEAAAVYRGVIPADCWHEPYMSLAELNAEIAAGVEFWGYADGSGGLLGVMGIQDRGEVALIRHAYVRSDFRRGGIGGALLRHLEGLTHKPILIGTWAAASWAVAFYRRHGYRSVPSAEKNHLLRRYWDIPERQVATSVVLVRPTRTSSSPAAVLATAPRKPVR